MPRVLVIEDHPLNRELVVDLLRDEGCEARTADTAEAGLSLVAAERPDLILMDIDLPGMSGYEAARRLKADPATRAIPILALTAHALRGAGEKARAAGCDDFLPKPLDIGTFRETLRRFLRGSDKGTK